MSPNRDFTAAVLRTEDFQERQSEGHNTRKVLRDGATDQETPT